MVLFSMEPHLSSWDLEIVGCRYLILVDSSVGALIYFMVGRDFFYSCE